MLPIATVALQLHLDTQTGFIAREDGLQVISTLNPLESLCYQTLRGKNFTSGWIHAQRIMSSHLEGEIVQSSGEVLQQSQGPVNIFPEACGIEVTTEAITAHVKYYSAVLQNYLHKLKNTFISSSMVGSSEIFRVSVPCFLLKTLRHYYILFKN